MFGANIPIHPLPVLNNGADCGGCEIDDLDKRRRERILQDDDEVFTILKMAVKILNI